MQAFAEGVRRMVRSAKEGDFDAYYYANEIFHQAIYTASQSAFLAEQCTSSTSACGPPALATARTRAYNHLFAEHAAVVEAIVAGSAEKARTQLRAHVVVQGDRFSDLLASLDQLKQGSAPT